MQFPEQHFQSLKQSLGGEFDAFLQAYDNPAPVSIRINPSKAISALSHFGSEQSDRVAWCENGYYLKQRPSFTHDPLFHAGCYYVQEASSMFLSHVAKTVFSVRTPSEPKGPSIKVLDLSAAPGGKSTLLASELNDDSLLVCNEVIRSRAHILAENLTKWGKANVVVSNNDPEDFQKLNGFFDVIVVDAPCSGEGLFRRDPHLVEEWSPENVDLCSARQRRIVLDIWPALKEGGLLIYSTCTFNTKENEENLAWLSSQIGFESVKVALQADWGIAETCTPHHLSPFDSAQDDKFLESRSVVRLSGTEVDNKKMNLYSYRFYPHRIKGEGFFISVLRKTEEQSSSTHKEKTLFPPAPSKERNAVAAWLNDPERFDFIRRGDHVLALPKQHTEAMHRLSRTLNCLQYGIAVADAQKGLKPLHDLAMSIDLRKDAFHQTELTKDEALKFLAKEDFKVNDPHKGISLMMYEGFPLGWMNLLGNRANNLYPKEWRIRKL